MTQCCVYISHCEYSLWEGEQGPGIWGCRRGEPSRLGGGGGATALERLERGSMHVTIREYKSKLTSGASAYVHRFPAHPAASLYCVLVGGLGETPSNGETGLCPLGPAWGTRRFPRRGRVDRGTVHSSLERKGTAVSACHQGGLPGRGGLPCGLE